MKNMRWLGVGVLVVVLAACGKQAAEPAVAIPVLVVHPTTQDGQAAAAYPGEVRARQHRLFPTRLCAARGRDG